jgi:dTMP kinase
VSRGRFIVLEGGEGAGKSTQVQLLADKIRANGLTVHVTREVGGSPLAEEIRQFWLADRTEKWDSLTELMLIFAARREHLTKTVWPLLEAGTWVVCDRFFDSTLVYQGDGMGLNRDHIQTLYAMIADGFTPDMTLILDLPVEISRQRIAGRELDRYERASTEFHERLRHGFKALVQQTPERRKLIDAAQILPAVHAAIWAHVQPLLAA